LLLFLVFFPEEFIMLLFRNTLLALAFVALLTACATTPGEPKAKVICPACGTDFDALYHVDF
jgi:hypothetical protein